MSERASNLSGEDTAQADVARLISDEINERQSQIALYEGDNWFTRELEQSIRSRHIELFKQEIKVLQALVTRTTTPETIRAIAESFRAQRNQIT